MSFGLCKLMSSQHGTLSVPSGLERIPCRAKATCRALCRSWPWINPPNNIQTLSESQKGKEEQHHLFDKIVVEIYLNGEPWMQPAETNLTSVLSDGEIMQEICSGIWRSWKDARQCYKPCSTNSTESNGQNRTAIATRGALQDEECRAFAVVGPGFVSANHLVNLASVICIDPSLVSKFKGMQGPANEY